MVHVPSADLSPEELAKLRFLAARHFRNLGASSTKLCSHGPCLSVQYIIMGMGSILISLPLDVYYCIQCILYTVHLSIRTCSIYVYTVFICILYTVFIYIYT